MLPLLEATDAPLEDIVEGEPKEGEASNSLVFAGAGRKPLWIGELVEVDNASDDDVGENTLSSTLFSISMKSHSYTSCC